VWHESTEGFYKSETVAGKAMPEVLWVYKDSVDKSSEKLGKSALELKLNEISDVIETETSYLIIKRVAGYTELANMLSKDCEIKVNKKIIEKTVVKDL
jgi:hypothetical protein